MSFTAPAPARKELIMLEFTILFILATSVICGIVESRSAKRTGLRTERSL